MPTLAERTPIETREEVNVSSTIELTLDDPNRVIEGIVPDILKITLEHQQGRGTTNVPSGTTFIKWYIYYIHLHTHL